MRGQDSRSGSLFSYVDLEQRVRSDHPLRTIRTLVNEALASLDGLFGEIYSEIGRPSIPPEQLLRAMLLQAFYSVRSERQLMEQLDFNLLFRWFVGLGIDDPVWDASTFSKNRDRLLDGSVAAAFLSAVLAIPRVRRLLSQDHFSVDGTLIQGSVHGDGGDLESEAAGGAPPIAEPAASLGDHRAPFVGSGCDTRHEPESTMTDDTMPFLDALLKRGGGDFMKELAEEVLGRLMAYDVEGQIGAGRYERNEERTTQRNGYRHRAFDTRLGTLDLKIPKLRKGSYFPGFLEPRRTTEQALVAVIQEAWIQGVSTRKVDDLVQAMGMSGISKSQVSELCKGIDVRVNSFLERPIEGEWTYLWLDATYLKVRENGRIVSVAAIIATGVNTDGRREILGLGLGPSEAAIFWLGFLRGLEKRGLRGVKLVISDAHEGLKAAIAQVFKATWQRCRVHLMRNALAYVPKAQHQMVAAAIRTVFMQADHAAASKTWRQVADQLRARIPKLAAMMDEAEADVIAYLAFPKSHWPKLHSTNPIERLNKEVKRRADVVGIFPNEASITRLVGAILLEQNDEWQLQHRYMTLETMAGRIDEQPATLTHMAA